MKASAEIKLFSLPDPTSHREEASVGCDRRRMLLSLQKQGHKLKAKNSKHDSLAPHRFSISEVIRYLLMPVGLNME